MRIRTLCTVLVLALLVLAGPLSAAQAMTVSLHYAPSGDELINPYIGTAVWSTSSPVHEQPYSLVYVDVTWAELEPEKGVYDFEALEARCNLAYWREQGVHAILRFVMDKPGEKRHMDIPQWLFDETGDGQTYSISYGRGYCPDYANETLIRAHARVIAALGAQYGDDPFFAYVQLGSLGHWGEWHVHTSLALSLPPMAIRDRYVEPYVEAFPDAFLMMRRPFTHAAENGMGLYNDTTGDLAGTETWLTWIQEGGTHSQTGDEAALVAMPDAWRSVPIGGELTTYTRRDNLIAADLFEQTLSLLTLSHTSWIGPGSFADVERDGKLQENLDTVMRTIGYRLRIEKLDIADAPQSAVRFSLTWVNDGIAPFYFPWTPSLRVESARGETHMYPLDFQLVEVQPDAPYSINVTIPKDTLPDGEFTLSVGILNPVTGAAAVALAMDTPVSDGWYELARLTVR